MFIILEPLLDDVGFMIYKVTTVSTKPKARTVINNTGLVDI